MNVELQIYHSYASMIEAARSGNIGTKWILYETKANIEYKANAWQRFITVAEATNAPLLYSDYFIKSTHGIELHPTIDYQVGSIRDDFDFGSAILLKSELVSDFANTCEESYKYEYAGFYALRLYLSRRGQPFHIAKPLYIEDETDRRTSGEKQFDYVNPAKRQVQLEVEQAASVHLREINALVDIKKRVYPDLIKGEFPVEASVIIPVRNRERTIRDAVESALEQKCKFPFNVIVVDNHSSDETSSILKNLEKQYSQLKVLVPQGKDLGIGGCWNLAINSELCGRFAVQLDSDDLYSSPSTLQTIVTAFYEQDAAMVIGAYRICDFELNTLPPGLISHSEWTDENGANNALRINGLGAPRAFFTPILREIQFPNTSYGEDYAVGLAFSRKYKIGRIYDELYLCRRWEGNSDAVLSVEQVNKNNSYKDSLRTIEILERIKLNS